MRLNFHLQTLGCKTNQYESQGIREALLGAGFTETSSPDGADLFVLNTCSVTARADASCRNAVRALIRANPEAQIIVTGCAVDLDEDWVTSFPQVRHVVPNALKHSIASLAMGLEASGETPDSFSFAITGFEGRTRAFIKVQDGCDCFCSYCTVPYARGTPRSRDIVDVLEEARSLIDNGYRELVLTGINAGQYALASGERLHDLVARVAQLPQLTRLRLSSVEPPSITDDLLRVIAEHPHVCPHLHIPLQSGDDTILKAMNRTYSSSDYLHLLSRARELIERLAITTDVIVGFPGEDAKEFSNTIQVCRKAGFSRTHVFLFSPRPGTAASRLKQTSPDREIKERKDRLLELAAASANDFACLFLGESVYVIPEKLEEDRLVGYTERYVRASLCGDDSLIGTIQEVAVTSVASGTIHGELV